MFQEDGRLRRIREKFSLARKGDKTALSFDVIIPANTKPDSYDLTAMADS